MDRCRAVIGVGILMVLTGLAPSALGSTGNRLTIERVASVGVSRAVYATHSPDPLDANKLFTVHQDGQIRIVDLATKTVLPTPFLTVPGNSGTESGLVGLTFHPNYATNGRFFINRHDGSQLRIEEYQRGVSGNVANPTMVRRIWTHTQHSGSHNAGWIGFNPKETEEGKYYLWRTTGDGGGPGGGGIAEDGEPNNSAQHDPQNRAQTLGEPHGKVIRIDVGNSVPFDAFADPLNNYTIPPDNPFVLGPSNGLPHVQGHEVYALGLRHPWRSSFDRETGDFYIGEVSQDTVEEIDLIPHGDNSGLNFGWRLRDGLVATQTRWVPPQGGTVGGPAPANNTVPIYQFWHEVPPVYVPPQSDPMSLRGNSVSGGFVYRGPIAGLDGYYIFGDFGSGRLWSFTFDGSDPQQFDGDNTLDFINWNSSENALTFANGATTTSDLSGFGEDQAGNVYLVRYNGEILRIADAIISPRAPLFGDFTDDDMITSADWQKFKDGQGANFSGLWPSQSYYLGDLDGNLKHDLRDFALFRSAYEEFNGLGSFVVLVGVPEPVSVWLMSSSFLMVVAMYRKRRATWA